MKCLLISDKDVEKSAACLFVSSGSLSDPIGSNN
jgi:secreted Zn-dependent insulinase-like peptidase